MQPEELYRGIGVLVKGRRRALGKKQRELAVSLGLSRASLANIETGRQKILVHQLYRLAEALEWQVTDLLPEPKEIHGSTEPFNLPIDTDVTPKQKEDVHRVMNLPASAGLPTTGAIDAKAKERRSGR